MKYSKTLLIGISLFFLVLPVVSVPDEPHRVFGAVEPDGDNIEVTFEYNGESIKQVETDDQGYYDTMIPYSSNYLGENIDILVEGEEKAGFEFEKLGVSEKNLEYEEPDDDNGDEGTEDNGDTEGDGMGGGPPVEDEEETEEETGEEKVSEGGKVVLEELEEENGIKTMNKDVEVDENTSNVDFSVGDEETSISSVNFDLNVESSKQVSTEVKDYGSEPPGNVDALEGVNSYKEITLEGLEDEEFENARVEYRVSKDKVDLEREYWNSYLNKYEGDSWVRKETEFKEETENHYIFEGRTESFSHFASEIEYDYELEVDVEKPETVKVNQTFQINTSVETPLKENITYVWDGEELSETMEYSLEEPGEHNIELEVTDGIKQEEKIIKIEVKEPEKDEEFTVGKIVAENTTISVMVSALLLIVILGVFYKFKIKSNQS